MKPAEVKTLNAEIQEKHSKLLQVKQAISRLDAEPQHDESALEQLHDIEAERQELLADAELASDDKQRSAIEKKLAELTSKAASLKQQAKAPGKQIAERKAALEARQEAIAAELAELKGQQRQVQADALEPSRAKLHAEAVKAAQQLIEAIGKHDALVDLKTQNSSQQFYGELIVKSDQALLMALAEIVPDERGVKGFSGHVKQAYRSAQIEQEKAAKAEWGLL